MINNILEWYDAMNKGACAAIAGTIGAVVGYLLRSLVYLWIKEKEWKGKNKLEELKRKHELIKEFLGRPMQNFHTLLHGGSMIHEEKRREYISIVNQWIEMNNMNFSKDIRSILNQIRVIAGSMVADNGVKLMTRTEAIVKANEFEAELERYMENVEKRLS